MACHGSSGIEATLKCFLDKCPQCNPHLLHISEVVPFLKWPLVKSSGEKEADCIIYQLAIGVRVVAHDCNFGAILDVLEENFRGIGGGILAAKSCIVELHHSRSQQAIYHGQLIQNFPRGHARMPSLDGWVIQYLECTVDLCVKCIETRTFHIL